MTNRTTPATSQASFLPPDAAALAHLVRENLRLLAELSQRYEVSRTAELEERSGFAMQISSPLAAYTYLEAEMAGLDQEQLRVILLDTKNRVIAFHLVYQGTVNSAHAEPRDIFREAIRQNAVSLVIAHNHPSGDPTPSQDDIEVTNRLAEAGRVLGIEVADHIVIGKGGRYVSLRERGLFSPKGSGR
jgi:DNA repair protein RadC